MAGTPNTQGGQSHNLGQISEVHTHVRIHKSVPPPLESFGRILHQRPDFGSRLHPINTYFWVKLIEHETVLTTRQEFFEYNCRFAINTPQSLLYVPEDLRKLRHVLIEHLCVLARDSLEHSREAGIFKNPRACTSCAGCSFIH